MDAAVQRIGDLFGSTHGFYLWVLLCHRTEFIAHLGDVRFHVIELTPLSALDSDIKLIYERTSKIIDAHIKGYELVTVLDRAELHWDEGNFETYLEGIDSLSKKHIDEWGRIASYVVTSIRSVRSRMILQTQLTTAIGSRRYLRSLSGIFNLA